MVTEADPVQSQLGTVRMSVAGPDLEALMKRLAVERPDCKAVLPDTLALELATLRKSLAEAEEEVSATSQMSPSIQKAAQALVVVAQAALDFCAAKQTKPIQPVPSTAEQADKQRAALVVQCSEWKGRATKRQEASAEEVRTAVQEIKEAQAALALQLETLEADAGAHATLWSNANLAIMESWTERIETLELLCVAPAAASILQTTVDSLRAQMEAQAQEFRKTMAAADEQYRAMAKELGELQAATGPATVHAAPSAMATPEFVATAKLLVEDKRAAEEANCKGKGKGAAGEPKLPAGGDSY